ncbi:hypothetical protein TBLA_0A01815 [Henningerozyma blattae CBS 6284]|uniref:RCC1-like domain-containing protein n=1 Tax=Henningerozyma blattae (strain ATCC 34711 / CBS 6284 / DSM 70876 / NBRC 10599 / NRRL Y-10934 / UCD 77-7) TaxID=1071380 RepID=I2GV30_HENB6|nr:hypothetical protein TBLA_0A01815 [Tetrapisispora blattae CBS 6284]CCH57982.1 hypothetical protein TBLA_0A01815 [Tetrapisispora blattae CBS 6284]
MPKRARSTNSTNKTANHQEKKPSKSYTSKIINNINDYKQLNISLEPLDVFTWGTGSMCELGQGPLAKNKEIKRPRINNYLNKEDIGIVSITVGGMHTIALDKNENIWSWGCNDVGALGRDTSGAKEVLKDMDKENASSDEDDDGDLNDLESTPMKIEKHYFKESLDQEAKIVQLTATDNASCILFNNGDVYAWGTFRCNEGILGFYKEDIKIQRTPWKLPSFSKYNIVQIASGKDHLLFLDESGEVFAWGNGQQNQLGRKILERFRLKTLDPRSFGLRHVKYIASGENHCFALKKDGTLVSWGLNQFGQCGISEEIQDGGIVSIPKKVLLPVNSSNGFGKIKMICAGEHHSLLLNEDGDIYSFGRLDMCEVGISKKDLPDYVYKDVHEKPRSIPIPTLLKGNNNEPLPNFKYIDVGSHHSIAISTNGIMYSWGFGDTYAVGLGPTDGDTEIPTRIKNTATADEQMIFVGCGGQFSVAGGIKLSDKLSQKRKTEMGDD